MTSKYLHVDSCAFIACSKSLLQAGLEDVLSSIPKTSNFHNSICLACCKVVFTKEKEIFACLSGMMNSIQSQVSVDLKSKVVTNLSVHQNSSLSFCGVRNCGGRSLVTTQATMKGTELLSDYPYVSCVAGSCSCREETLLVEHLQMAGSIMYNKQRDMRMHNIFLKNVCSALDCEGWSNHLIYTVCLTSALITLFTLREQRRKNSMNSHHIAGTTELEEQIIQRQHLSDCLEYCDILGRLPINVHAVTKISTNNSEMSNSTGIQHNTVVEQVRLGYNLYLTASSVNHSCMPNACIKFKLPSDSSTSTLDQLLATRVEVVTVEDLPRKSEITVSYGPLHGVHQLKDRRNALMSQYQFHCLCRGCSEDEERKRRTEEAAVSEYAGLTSAEGKLNEQMKKESKTVLDTVLLCETLKGLELEIQDIGTKLASILRESKGRENLLMSLERQSLQKVKSKVESVQTQYFPETLPLMSTPMLDVGCPLSNAQADNSLCSEFCGILLAYLDIHAHVLALLHQYSAAATLVHTSITVMVGCRRYRDSDVVVARERVKLAQLLFSSGQRGYCLAAIKRAQEDLRPSVSEDDPDWIESCSIITHLVRHNS